MIINAFCEIFNALSIKRETLTLCNVHDLEFSNAGWRNTKESARLESDCLDRRIFLILRNYYLFYSLVIYFLVEFVILAL